MPITCPISFESLSTDQMRAFDRPVMRCAFDVQNDLGRLCDEIIYKNSFRQRLSQSGFDVNTEVPIELSFDRFAKTLYVDVVTSRRVPYELKAVKQLTAEHETQLLTYMLLIKANRGKLINFRSMSVESRFVNASITWEERHRFEPDTQNWAGDPVFRTLVERLIRDWGTCLSGSLYTQAIAANLGGEEAVEHRLPLMLDRQFVGYQKFQLFAPDTAFNITTFNRNDLSKQESHLTKLIAATQLKSMYWVNVGRHEVLFRTIQP